jgi:hypothetical protein
VQAFGVQGAEFHVSVKVTIKAGSIVLAPPMLV